MTTTEKFIFISSFVWFLHWGVDITSKFIEFIV